MSAGSAFFLLAAAAVMFAASGVIIRFLDESMMIRISKESYIKGVIVFLSFMVLVMLYNGRGSGQGKETKDNGKYYMVMDAFEDAKNGIRKMLRSPSTAEFAGTEDTRYRINPDNSVTFESHVDSQNGFGAMIRTYYRCTVRDGRVEDVVTW